MQPKGRAHHIAHIVVRVTPVECYRDLPLEGMVHVVYPDQKLSVLTPVPLDAAESGERTAPEPQVQAVGEPDMRHNR